MMWLSNGLYLFIQLIILTDITKNISAYTYIYKHVVVKKGDNSLLQSYQIITSLYSFCL